VIGIQKRNRRQRVRTREDRETLGFACTVGFIGIQAKALTSGAAQHQGEWKARRVVNLQLGHISLHRAHNAWLPQRPNHAITLQLVYITINFFLKSLNRRLYPTLFERKKTPGSLFLIVLCQSFFRSHPNAIVKHLSCA
jgi:hypothetical protein